MASESREEQSLSVDLSAELEQWLEERVEGTDTSRDEVIRQLLETYRATETLDETAVEEITETVEATIADEATKATRAVVADRLEAELPERLDDEVEGIVQQEVETAVEKRVGTVVDDRLAEAIETAIADRLPDIADAVESRLDGKFEAATDEVEADVERLETDFQRKLDDVRERVIQVKKEADAKAPADHGHEGLDRIGELDDELEAIGTDLLTVQDDIDELTDRTDETDEALTDVRDRLDDAEDKLKRVAWVVSDLRDDVGETDNHERAVARLKRAAAQEGVTKANCENCGDAVEISLLTDPECPHCNAAVTDVRPDGGLFRTKARLVTAAELEAGEDG